MTAALVVTDQNGDVVLEFPFSESLAVLQKAGATKH